MVVAGEHDLTKKEGTEQMSDIAEFIVHPDYSEVKQTFFMIFGWM